MTAYGEEEGVMPRISKARLEAAIVSTHWDKSADDDPSAAAFFGFGMRMGRQGVPLPLVRQPNDDGDAGGPRDARQP